jgi:adenosylhomocysteine nucleosidase
MLTVVAALEQELSGVRQVLRGRKSVPVDLQVIGVGKRQAQDGVGKILAARRWSPEDDLLLLGFAGGLDPALKVGDLLVPTSYYRESGAFLLADAGMWQHARLAVAEFAIPVVQGNSLTVEEVVVAPEDKKELYRQHQVGSVNMEDYWVAEVAAEAKVPFLSVRAILDPVYQELPYYVQGLSGQPVKAVLRATVSPWHIPTLVKLAGTKSAAQSSLTRFALAFINYRLATAMHRPSAN